MQWLSTFKKAVYITVENVLGTLYYLVYTFFVTKTLIIAKTIGAISHIYYVLSVTVGPLFFFMMVLGVKMGISSPTNHMSKTNPLRDIKLLPFTLGTGALGPCEASHALRALKYCLLLPNVCRNGHFYWRPLIEDRSTKT